MLLLRRELADAIDEFPVPFQMRRDVESLLEQPASPSWLWRAFDQLLDVYTQSPALRRRVERIFERALVGTNTFTNGIYGNTAFGNTAFANGIWGNGLFGNNLSMNGIYGNGAFGNGAFGNTAFTNGTYGNTAFGIVPQFGSTVETSVPVEVVERSQDIVVRVGLPGVRAHEVDARVTNDNVITIFVQRPNGLFTRTISLPRVVDPSRIQAYFVNQGTLEVCVAKLDMTRVQRVPVTRETSTFRGVSGIA